MGEESCYSLAFGIPAILMFLALGILFTEIKKLNIIIIKIMFSIILRWKQIIQENHPGKKRRDTLLQSQLGGFCPVQFRSEIVMQSFSAPSLGGSTRRRTSTGWTLLATDMTRRPSMTASLSTVWANCSSSTPCTGHYTINRAHAGQFR